jgi:hypothetical protein
VYGFQLVQLGQSPVTPGEPGSERPPGEHRPHVLDPLSILGMQFLRGEQVRPRCLPKAGARVVLEYGWVPEHRELGSHGRMILRNELRLHLMPGNEDEAVTLLDSYLELANTRARLASITVR